MVDQRSGHGGGRLWRGWLLTVVAVLSLVLWMWLFALHYQDYKRVLQDYRVSQDYKRVSHTPYKGGAAERDAATIREAAERDAATIREMIKHENELTNHRLTWLLTTEGLLFAALALVQQKTGDLEQRTGDLDWSSDLVLVLSLAGISVAASSQVVLSTAHTAFLELDYWWRINRPSLNHPMPDVVGFRGYNHGSPVWWYLSPWRAFPLLFIVGWWFIGARFLRRTGA